MIESSQSLLDVLQRVITGLADPANHYMISANYYERLTPGQSSSQRWHIAVLYLHQEAAWNVALEPDGMLMDVILNQEEPDKMYRIKVPYTEIWQIQAGQSPAFTEEDRVYYDQEVFKKLLSYPLGG